MRLSNARLLVEVNAASTVEVIETPWLTFGSFARAVTEASRSIHDRGATAALERLLEGAHDARRTLAWSIAIDEDLRHRLGDLARSLETHVASGRDGSVHGELERIARGAHTLAAAVHPVGTILEGLVARYGPDEVHGVSGAVLVAPASEHEALRRWLDVEELDAEVLTPPQLRGIVPRDGLIILGPPARYFVSTWTPWDRAERLGSWMVATPPARSTHVVLLEGQPRFRDERTVLFPTSTPRPMSRRRVVMQEGPLDGTSWEWIDPPTPATPFVRSAWGGERDPVDATACRLTREEVAFFARGLGPIPRRITLDGDEVSVEEVSLQDLRIGTVLIFNSERATASLRESADAEIDIRLGPGSADRARALQAELKTALSAAANPTAVVDELGRRLGDVDYARGLVRRIPDENFIAPERPGAYGTICAVLGLHGADESAYRFLQTLRTEHRKAGRGLGAIQVQTLTESRSWEDELYESGHATVDASDGSGSFELRVVVAIEEGTLSVGRTRLGRLTPIPSNLESRSAE